MLDFNEQEALTRLAREIRLELLKEFRHLGFGHYGGALSIVELLAVLYGKQMNLDPENKDYLILSKGHAGPALYAALAVKGIIGKDVLQTLNRNKTILPSHPDRLLTPGVDMTTGSLGQGIAVAGGLALGLQLDQKSPYVYAIVGDGELNEGLCWEAVQFAAHHALSNLIVFVDYNKKQLDGYLQDICKEWDLGAKFAAFGFHTFSADGKRVEDIYKAIEAAKKETDRPKVIILDTVKSQGVPLLEEKFDNHHVRPSEEERKYMDDFIEALEREIALQSGTGVQP